MLFRERMLSLRASCTKRQEKSVDRKALYNSGDSAMKPYSGRLTSCRFAVASDHAPLGEWPTRSRLVGSNPARLPRTPFPAGVFPSAAETRLLSRRPFKCLSEL